MALKELAGNSAFQKDSFHSFHSLHCILLSNNESYILFLTTSKRLLAQRCIQMVFLFGQAPEERVTLRIKPQRGAFFSIFIPTPSLLLLHKRGSVIFSCIRCWHDGQVSPLLNRPLSLHLIPGQPLLGGKFCLAGGIPCQEWAVNMKGWQFPFASYPPSCREAQV